MKIKLIFPKKEGDPGAMGVTVPYVLPHLAAITPPGHEVSLVNLFKEELDLSNRPDMVGISVMTRWRSRLTLSLTMPAQRG